MKILQINTVYEEKSTGRTCLEIERELLSNGHECITAYGVGNHKNNKNTYRIDKRIEYFFHNIMSRLTGLEGYYSYFATKRLVKFIDKYEPDIVHLRNLHGHYLNLPILFKFLQKKQYPVVQNLHDCWAYTGKCVYYTTQNCYKWKNECGKCPKLKEYPKSWILDFTKKMRKDKEKWYSGLKNLTVVGVSNWVAREAKQSFFGSNNILCIYNWINQEIFHPYPDCDEDTKEKYGIPTDKFIILGVSASWDQGTPRYEDFKRLSENLHDDEMIVLVGTVKKPINSENVIHIGFVSNTTELAKIYSCSNVYVHCSIEDTFGKVIAESLSCGTPAIVYNVTACGEIVGSKCGFSVTPRNVKEIYDKIKIIKGKNKSFYIHECTELVSNNYYYKKNIIKLIGLYKQLSGGTNEIRK